MSSEADLLALLGRASSLSYYQLLGLPHRYATAAQVKEAFHAFAQLYHPDLFHDTDESFRTAAKELFKRAVEAYEVLRDVPLQKRYVEKFLKQGQLRLPPEEFSRRAALEAGAKRPSLHPPAPPRPVAPMKPQTWIDEMKTEDGREVAERIERMMHDGRFREALNQIDMLRMVEGDTPPVRAREAMLRRRIEQTRR